MPKYMLILRGTDESNAALMAAFGVYQRIFERWGMSEAMVNQSVVNAASSPGG